jgi:hypothetical protein
LVIHQVAFARQLQCKYQTANWNYWPSYKECFLTSVDLSEVHKSGGHSFTGSSSEKSEVSTVTFYQSKVVDFVPAEVTREIPKLNALDFQNSNVPVVKTGLLGSEFKNLQFLNFWQSKVEAIEDGAFTELENLKVIYIALNPLKTLSFGLFRTNLKLEIVRFVSNKISMIHPALFNDLTHLKRVEFSSNVCVNRQVGCVTCTVSQSELKSGLSTCFANCQDDLECSNPAIKDEILKNTKTIKSELTSSIAQIDKKLTNSESISEANSKSQSTEIEKISQKNAQVEEKLQENLAKSQKISTLYCKRIKLHDRPAVPDNKKFRSPKFRD